MSRSTEENRTLFLKKAPLVRDQKHFDQIMNLFPKETRQEIYDEVKPLLRVSLVLTIEELEPKLAPSGSWGLDD
jgi:hypothetical protein